MGRIDQWQDGVEGILPYKDQNGLLRIPNWNYDHMKTIVRSALEDGTCKRPDTGYGSSAPRKTTSKKSAKVAELVAIVDMEETSPPSCLSCSLHQMSSGAHHYHNPKFVEI